MRLAQIIMNMVILKFILDDLIQLRNLSKCVTIKDSQSINGKNIKIISCDESYIYLNGAANLVKISNCINCTIMVLYSNYLRSQLFRK